jgi:competence protein ComEC
MGDAGAGDRASPQIDPASNSIERNLIECCHDSLKADILVVGHHGSKSSSRTAFLNAVGADTFIVSSGPKKYGSVVLPDDIIISELESRGTVYRTDLNDDTCGTNTAKIGPDNDGKAGGCDNIRITVSSNGTHSSNYWLQAD